MNIPHLIIGASMLFLGRKPFWLFVGCIGFAVGYTYIAQLLGSPSDYIIMAVAVLTGVVCGLTAVFLEEAAIGISGFLSGAYITLYLLRFYSVEISQWIWAAGLAGGIIGAALMVFIFDWALILLSSLAGASLILQSGVISQFTQNSMHTSFLFFGLLVLGGAVQAKMLAPKSESRGRRWRQHF